MSEFQKTIEKHPFLTMSFLLLLTVALLFENVLMNDAIHVNRQDQKLQSWTDKHFYTLTDTVSQEEEAALWKSDDCILRMKSVVDAFEEAYGYCVYGQQQISIEGLRMPDEFYYPLPRDAQGNKLYEDAELICRQVNSYAWDLFQMQTVEGRGLQPGDYEYEDEIPVVLGNAYSGYLKVGDVLESVGRRLKVVGILQPNIVVRFQDRLEQLDWTIVMPSRELPEGMDGRIPYDTQLGTDYRMDYIQKLGGIFALSSENELPELMRFIDETVKKYGVFSAHDSAAAGRAAAFGRGGAVLADEAALDGYDAASARALLCAVRGAAFQAERAALRGAAGFRREPGADAADCAFGHADNGVDFQCAGVCDYVHADWREIPAVAGGAESGAGRGGVDGYVPAIHSDLGEGGFHIGARVRRKTNESVYAEKREKELWPRRSGGARAERPEP